MLFRAASRPLTCREEIAKTKAKTVCMFFCIRYHSKFRKPLIFKEHVNHQTRVFTDEIGMTL